MISRRRFLKTLTAAGGMLGAGLPEVSLASNAPIDRAALVSRHNPVLRQLDPLSPLTIGNGEFAFTADVTGLQTLAREYENAMPLCTMSQWGWHTRPTPDNVASKTLRLTQYATYGREPSPNAITIIRRCLQRMEFCRVKESIARRCAGRCSRR